MDFRISESACEFGTQARQFALNDLAPGVLERANNHQIPHDIIKALAKLGLMGVNIPKRLGGAERGVVAYALALREIASVDASVAVTMAVTNMVSEIILAFGTQQQQAHFIPKLVSGEFFAGSFALSEAGSGSDAASLSTKAEKTPTGYRLHGEKAWITSGDQAGVWVVWARTGAPDSKHRGISCFLVEGGTPGVEPGKPENKMGLRASHTVPLRFNDVRVGEQALLGQEGEGFKIAMHALDGGRVGIASQALGMGRSAFRFARDWLAGRDVDQNAHFALADMMTTLDTSWLLTLRAAWLKEVRRPFSQEAAMAKVASTEGANRVIRRAMGVVGTEASSTNHLLSRLFRDCRVTQIYEGTSEIQRVVIARQVLK
jgi:alkylation response protein AidB-like acyl-CoA dehydrogenase